MTGPVHDRVLVPLGERVRALRTARGFTLRDLADRSSLSTRFLASLEAGEGNISVVRLVGLAGALGTSAATLLEGIAVPHARPRAVALLGVRGAGKSTIGRALARRLHVPFAELDALIEREAGLTLREIFDVHGEPYFRRVEREVLLRFLDEHEGKSAVLATGGGIVNDPRTWKLLRARALCVWLKATAEDHWTRVLSQGDRRPMAENPHAFAELKALLAARAPRYSEAEVVVDTSRLDVDEAAHLIAASLERASSAA